MSHDDRPGPDPHRPGTVYRSRPRLLRLGRSGRPPRSVPPASPDAAGIAGEAGAGDAAAYPPPAPYGADAGAVPYPPAYPPAYPPPGAPGGPGAPGDPGTYGPGGGGGTARLRRRRRRWPWVALVLVLLVAYPVLLGIVAWSSLGKVDAMPTSGRPAQTPGRTYLVVGSDSRQDLSRAERARLGTGQAAGQRTDTIMLLHVPAGGGPTVLVSVPRDSYVAIPGHGKNKINAAYAFGGPQLLVRTVEQATGVRVDDYVETGLGGYADLVDAIGGVDVCVKKAIKDDKAHINLPAGCQTLDGQKALGYARARYSDPRGDLGRVERQRQVLAAIAGKTLSPSVLLLPWRSFPAARSGGGALTVDSGTTPYGLAQFVLAMRAVSGGGGLSLTVPIGGDITTSAGDSLQWDRAKANQLFAALKADDTEKIRPLADEQKKAAAKA